MSLEGHSQAKQKKSKKKLIDRSDWDVDTTTLCPVGLGHRYGPHNKLNYECPVGLRHRLEPQLSARSDWVVDTSFHPWRSRIRDNSIPKPRQGRNPSTDPTDAMRGRTPLGHKGAMTDRSMPPTAAHCSEQ
ncbi:unnamed protein product [Urochloa humidicola]